MYRYLSDVYYIFPIYIFPMYIISFRYILYLSDISFRYIIRHLDVYCIILIYHSDTYYVIPIYHSDIYYIILIHTISFRYIIPMEAFCLFTRGLALGHATTWVLTRNSHFPLSSPNPLGCPFQISPRSQRRKWSGSTKPSSRTS